MGGGGTSLPHNFGLTVFLASVRIAPLEMAMAKRTADAGGEPPPGEFLAGLDKSARLLLSLREELYEGSWEMMVGDLEARLGGRPYIFKLSQRIEKDLENIRKIRGYEERNGLNLSDYL